MITALTWLGAGLLGGCGALARYRIDGVVSSRWPHPFPFGTLVVNCSGAFVLGLLVGIALPKQATLDFGTGLVGGYTTFSTWMVESERLTEDGQHVLMLVNVFGSIGLGLGFAGLGWLMGARLG